MALGKTIRIYLADGTVSGIKHGEIVNWTGQAIQCPRSRFQELREWPEAKRPGVYFLFGVDEETGQDAVYIGEAEVVLDRLYSHISGKDFWTELIAFTNKDDNLTKGHVRYLESRLIELAIEAGRYVVKNNVSPQLPALPRSDRDAMEEYIETTRILLGVLGHKVLEQIVEAVRQTSAKVLASQENDEHIIPEPEAQSTSVTSTPTSVSFVLRTGGLSATAISTDEGMVVLKDSQAAPTELPSLSIGYRNIRDKLLQTGVLTQEGSTLKFTKNHLFSSPSQAAAVIVGYAINGRHAWQLPDGTTYAAYEERLTEPFDKLLASLDALPCSQ